MEEPIKEPELAEETKEAPEPKEYAVVEPEAVATEGFKFEAKTEYCCSCS